MVLGVVHIDLGSSFLFTAVWNSTVCTPCLSSDCYNKVPQAGWLINHRTVFLTVLEAGNLRSGSRQGRVPAGSLSQVSDSWLLLVPSCGGQSELALCSLLIGALIPFLRASL